MNTEQLTAEALANELQHEIDRLTTLCRGQHVELYSARIELKTLKQDAARYQFVKSLSRASSANIDGNHSWTCNLWINAIRGPNLDAALDAAMKGES
jgi:hypothetical protein